MMRVTVYDVAARAGVSISTVSRVLNSPERVSEPTRLRVLSAVDALGFVPKAEAAERARRIQGRIGVLAPFFTYPSFVQRLRGVASALADAPYELAIYGVESAAQRDAYLSTLSVTHRVDGLIVMALPFGDAIAERVLTHEVATVLVEAPRAGFSCVEIDDRSGGRMAAEYLLGRGHRRLAFVGDTDLPDYAIRTSDARLEGYSQALAAAGTELPDRYIALAPHGQETARRAAHKLFALPDPPTAIFTASDTQAMGVLKAARECKLAVPGGVAVVGFDDLEVADYIGLTTVRQPLDESGRVAVELLLRRLADPTSSPQRIRLPLKVVSRETA